MPDAAFRAPAMTAFVAYCRVSTSKQGKSGLGLEAQLEAVTTFLKPSDVLLQPPYVEVESGRKHDRPKLSAALDLCRKTGATLLIAKLDRLARNVAFIANLLESGVPFVAVDMPHADPFRLHIEAAIAEDEARKIATRTRAALQAAKARGVVLGGYRGVLPTDADRAKASEAVKARANQAAHSVLPLLEQLREQGATSLNALAGKLNELGYTTPRGGQWTATAVKRVIERVAT